MVFLSVTTERFGCISVCLKTSKSNGPNHTKNPPTIKCSWLVFLTPWRELLPQRSQPVKMTAWSSISLWFVKSQIRSPNIQALHRRKQIIFPVWKEHHTLYGTLISECSLKWVRLTLTCTAYQTSSDTTLISWCQRWTLSTTFTKNQSKQLLRFVSIMDWRHLILFLTRKILKDWRHGLVNQIEDTAFRKNLSQLHSKHRITENQFSAV